MHCVCRVDKENTRVIQWIQTYWLHNVYYMCDLACIRSALRCDSQSRAIKDNVHVSDNKFVSIGLHGMLVYTESEWYNSIYRKERQKVHRSYNFHSLPHNCVIVSLQLYIILVRPERNVRKSMMAANRFKSGLTKPAVTGQSSMMSTVMVTMSTCNQKEKLQPQMSNVEFSGEIFDTFINWIDNLINFNALTFMFNRSHQHHEQ